MTRRSFVRYEIEGRTRWMEVDPEYVGSKNSIATKEIVVTLLYLLNFILFQWFFVRITRLVVEGTQVGWTVVFGVIPLTGWWCDYKYVVGFDGVNLGRLRRRNCIKVKR